MPIPYSIRFLTLTTALTAGIPGMGCSSSEKSPALETTASVAAAPPAAMSTADTSSAQKPDTNASARPAPQKTTSEAQPVTNTSRPKTQATAPQPATSPGPVSRDSATPGQEKWLSYDAATNTVTFELIGGPRGFEFNGYASGGATLTVPSEANIVMSFVNKDGTPHSAEIISGDGPLPNAGVEAAIPRAYTRQLSQGLAQEETDVMRFAVPKSGTYRIFCGVSGHGPSGMWIWLNVDPAAKAPSFGPTKG